MIAILLCHIERFLAVENFYLSLETEYDSCSLSEKHLEKIKNDNYFKSSYFQPITTNMRFGAADM